MKQAVAARAIHEQRLNECITCDEFANEMQTTYPRNIIQDFMNYAEENHGQNMFRSAWLDIFYYWQHTENVDLRGKQ